MSDETVKDEAMNEAEQAAFTAKCDIVIDAMVVMMADMPEMAITDTQDMTALRTHLNDAQIEDVKRLSMVLALNFRLFERARLIDPTVAFTFSMFLAQLVEAEQMDFMAGLAKTHTVELPAELAGMKES